MVSKIYFIPLVFLLSSCALSPTEAIQYQKEHGFDKQKFKTNSGGTQSVDDLREIYKNVTGLNLPEQNTSECLKDNVCYYNKYANVGDAANLLI